MFCKNKFSKNLNYERYLRICMDLTAMKHQAEIRTFVEKVPNVPQNCQTLFDQIGDSIAFIINHTRRWNSYWFVDNTCHCLH